MLSNLVIYFVVASAFKLSLALPPKLVPATTTTTTTTTAAAQVKAQLNANYMGCYVDEVVRDLSGSEKDFGSNNTIENCALFCWQNNYKYAGAQYGSQCFCGNTYGAYGSAGNSNCNYACTGNPKEYCGGYWTNSIYSLSCKY